MSSDRSTPEDVVRALFAAANAGRWADVVRLGDDESLREFHRASGDADDDEPNMYVEHVFGVRTAAELAAMTPAEAAERWLRGHDPIVTLRQYAAHFGHRLPPDDELEAMVQRHVEVLGHVDQGTDVSHVLYRERHGSTTTAVEDALQADWLPQPQVVVLVRARDGGWRVRMDFDFLTEHMARNIAIGGAPDGDTAGSTP